MEQGPQQFLGDHPAGPAGTPSHSKGQSLPPPLRLQLTSDSEQIAPARKAVEAFVRAAGLGPGVAADLGLVVNEALANVVRHAYHGEPGRPIFLTGDCDDSELRLTIRDWGSGANPAARPTRPRDPATPGGLGLVCLRSLTDGAEFAPQPDGMLLTITKKRGGPPRGPRGEPGLGQPGRDQDPTRIDGTDPGKTGRAERETAGNDGAEHGVER